MNTGLSNTNPTLVAAFRAALLHQGLIVAVLLAVLALGWVCVRDFSPAARHAAMAGWAQEPAARRLLRIGSGILWIFDGRLRAQPAMAAGLPAGVIERRRRHLPGCSTSRASSKSSFAGQLSSAAQQVLRSA